jgi:hypothetical protein
MTFHPTYVSIGDVTYAPVPEGMTYADAVAALADAGAWVEIEGGIPAIQNGVRYRSERRKNGGQETRYYVHRDDLPPADPDAELVEKMARAVLDNFSDTSNGYRLNPTQAARDALAVVREHEARS